MMTYFLDPEDPFPDGYTVADTWGVSTAGLSLFQKP